MREPETGRWGTVSFAVSLLQTPAMSFEADWCKAGSGNSIHFHFMWVAGN